MTITRFFASKYADRGFTMIELLVVIAIIGILAAAVLSAINPVEQINKGRDTRRRADAAELVNASERFYAVQERYPWNANSNPSTVNQAYTHSNWSWIKEMVDVSEVKKGLQERIQDHAAATSMMIYKAVNDDRVSVCFIPQSKQFKAEADERCVEEDDILPDPACGGTNKMICVP